MARRSNAGLVPLALSLALVPFAAGCHGAISGDRGEGDERPSVPADRPGTPTDRPGTASPAVPGNAMTAPAPSIPPPPGGVAAPRIDAHHGAIGLRRLSRFEYGNTVADLLGVKGTEAGIGDDDTVGFLSNNQNAMRVGAADLESYERSAVKIAAQAAPTLKLVGCTADAPTAECVGAFLPDFLLRAFRRPATAAETQRYSALFTALAADHGPADALRGVLQAVLLSPSFLYRTELGSDGKTLNAYEVASRLSYLVWGSMPDAELLAQAKANALSTRAQIEAQVKRLLADARAQKGILNIVYEWIGLHGVQLAKKGADITKGLSSRAQASMEEETRRFVTDALLAPGGSLAALYTAKHTFLNDAIAPLYGVMAPAAAEFRKVDLDPAVRRGLFTQPLVLAAHTKEAGYSVVQMGRFVRERLLCQLVPPPPPDAVTEIEETPATANLTYRQKFDHHATNPACSPCHRVMDPPGYAFLSYDPIGRHQPKDPNGVPFDTKGELLALDGGKAAFATAPEMLDAIAGSQEAKGCAARKFTEYAFGRALATADVPLYERLVKKLEAGADFTAFLTELVGGREFLVRGPDETK